MKNTLIIKYYCDPMPGCRMVPLRWYERLYAMIGIKVQRRYTNMIRQRSTSLGHASSHVANIGYERVIWAEWIDRFGTGVRIVTDGKLSDRLVAVNRVDKSVKVIN